MSPSIALRLAGFGLIAWALAMPVAPAGSTPSVATPLLRVQGSPATDGGATLITTLSSIATVNRVTIDLPTGYILDAASMRQATSLGFAEATSLDGTPSRGKVMLTTNSAEHACPGGSHFAEWVLHFDSGIGDVPVDVDTIGDHVSWTVCPTNLESLTFANKVTSSPRKSGEFVWHATFDSAVDQPSEAQAIVRLPWIISLAHTGFRRVVTGTVTASSKPATKLSITVLAGRRSDLRGAQTVARVKTNSKGKFTVSLRARGKLFLSARASFDAFDDLVPCVGQTTGICAATIGLPYALQSRTAHLTVR